MEIVASLIIMELALCILIALVHLWDPGNATKKQDGDISEVLVRLKEAHGPNRGNQPRALVDLQLRELRMFEGLLDIPASQHISKRISSMQSGPARNGLSNPSVII